MIAVRFAVCDPTPEERHNAAWRLVPELFAENFGVSTADLRFARLAGGKPVCISHPDLFLSLTHTDRLAAAVVSDMPVGIDAETKGRDISARVIKRFLCMDAPDQSEALRRWTMLESAAKTEGKPVFGLTFDGIDTQKYSFTRIDLENEIIMICSRMY